MKLPKDKRMCAQCRQRPALYRQPNRRTKVFKFRKDHNLCNQCFRSIKESQYQAAVNG